MATKLLSVKEYKEIYGLSRITLINYEKKGLIKPVRTPGGVRRYRVSISRKNDRNFITVECLLVFDKDENREKVLNLMRKFSSMVRFAYKRLLEGVERKELKKMLSQKYGINTRYSDSAVIARRGLGFKERLPKNYRRLLEDKEFLSYSVARVEDRIAKLKKEIERKKNEYKRNKLKSRLRRLKRELKLLLKFLLDSGKGELAARQPVTPTPATPRKMERVRGPTKVGQKSWQVLSVALAFSCLESFRDFSPLKRVILLGDWVGVAKRKGLVPLPGQGTTAQNMCSFV